MFYISLKEATKYCNYSQEYLKLRARQRKLKAIKIGRNWVTTRIWLHDYAVKQANNVKPINVKPSLVRKIKILLIFLIFSLLIIGVIFVFQSKYSVSAKAYFHWIEFQLEEIIPARVIEIE